MLINLTNHPWRTWPEAQKAAAKRYGKTVDLPFPAVPPEAPTQEIVRLAEAHAQLCRDLLKQADPATEHAVHIMGEMTFVYHFVRQISQHSVLCLAATSARNATENDRGEKTSRFEFVMFRAYEVP